MSGIKRIALPLIVAVLVVVTVAAVPQVSAQPPQMVQGVRVDQVFPGYPAHNRLYVGDVILEVNGQRTRSSFALTQAVQNCNGHVRIQLVRAGNIEAVQFSVVRISPTAPYALGIYDHVVWIPRPINY